MQLQESLNVVYNTLESTIKAMDNVPQLMTEFSGALGSFSQQQLNAYMQFTEAREMLNEYEKQLEAAKAEYETAKTQRSGTGRCDKSSWTLKRWRSSSMPRTSPCRPVTCRIRTASPGC